MLAAAHYPTVYQRPVGLWWWDPADEVMRSYYLPGAEDQQMLGSDVMSGVSSAPQWEYWAQRMADRTPSTSSWETVDLNPESTPQEILRLLGSQRFVA